MSSRNAAASLRRAKSGRDTTTTTTMTTVMTTTMTTMTTTTTLVAAPTGTHPIFPANAGRESAFKPGSSSLIRPVESAALNENRRKVNKRASVTDSRDSGTQHTSSLCFHLIRVTKINSLYSSY
ncbi:unnamed protein product [Lasius platythorax]|uniref:Uncharacterized protein n=1 Tax=Lasius platythorax TaxID=488582 RepID=A0AAV2NR39_9HYME